MAPPKSKTWCFTVENPEASPDGENKTHWRTGPEAVRLLDLECQLLIIGYEVGEQGTPHLQGYVTFKYSKTLTAMKKINARAHWETARAEEQAANYCMKDGDYEKKDYRKQGARTDVRAAIDTLRLHGLKRVKRDHPLEFLKYPSGFAALDVLNEDERDFAPDVLWLWGTTGTGKSHFSKHIYPEQKRWWSGESLRWWQGYRGEPIVILDDFRPDFCKFRMLLRILDKYPLQVEIKGSSRELNSKLIIITTISHPDVLFAEHKGERLDQLTRRITKVARCTKSGDEWSLTYDPFLNKPYAHEEALAASPAAGPLSASDPPIVDATGLDLSLAGRPTPVEGRSTQGSNASMPETSQEGQDYKTGGPLADQDRGLEGDERSESASMHAHRGLQSYFDELAEAEKDDEFFNVPEGL